MRLQVPVPTFPCWLVLDSLPFSTLICSLAFFAEYEQWLRQPVVCFHKISTISSREGILIIAEGIYLLVSVRWRVRASYPVLSALLFAIIYCFQTYQLILITDHMRQPENLPRLKSTSDNIFSPLTLYSSRSLPSSLVRQSRIHLSQYPQI